MTKASACRANRFPAEPLAVNDKGRHRSHRKIALRRGPVPESGSGTFGLGRITRHLEGAFRLALPTWPFSGLPTIRDWAGRFSKRYAVGKLLLETLGITS